MNEIITQTLLAFAGTLGFCVLFRVPIRHIPVCGCIGGLSWLLYQLVVHFSSQGPVIATFLAAALVGLLSNLASRWFKDAATMFIIPGILPLVPGAYIFYSMEALLRDDVGETSSYGTETLKLAAAIALGLLLVGSLIRVFRAIIAKTRGVIRDHY